VSCGGEDFRKVGRHARGTQFPNQRFDILPEWAAKSYLTRSASPIESSKAQRQSPHHPCSSTTSSFLVPQEPGIARGVLPTVQKPFQAHPRGPLARWSKQPESPQVLFAISAAAPVLPALPLLLPKGHTARSHPAAPGAFEQRFKREHAPGRHVPGPYTESRDRHRAQDAPAELARVHPRSTRLLPTAIAPRQRERF
jgi:hypothetical protein